MKSFSIAAVALVSAFMVAASPIDVGTSKVAASLFDVDTSMIATSPAGLEKRANIAYSFYIRSGQLQKCVGNGPSPTCTFQPCFVPRLIQQDGKYVAGAATTNDKDWNCASFNIKSPPYARFNLKFTEARGCDHPVSIGNGVSYCFDGNDGRTVHFPGWGFNGKSGWCHLNGPDNGGTASCAVNF